MFAVRSRSLGVLGALVAFAGTSSLVSAQRAVLTQHVPTMVKEGRATRVAAVAGSAPLQVVLSLPLRNQDALNALLADLYNPASPSYHQWLQPADFDAQFGPTTSDYATLVSWARGNGLDVVAKSGNKRVLTVAGSTSLINRAFHVQETTYHDPNRNRDFISPDREPTTDLSIPLLAISGLDTSNPKVTHMKRYPDESLSRYVAIRDTGNQPRPAADCPGVAYGYPCTGSGPDGSFTPGDMRTAYYGVTGSGALTGAGQNVAIYSYDGYNSSDVAQWYSTVGVTPSTVPVTNVLTDGVSNTITSGQDGEQVLDILQVQGMAPGLSNIYFYIGDSAVVELNQMVSDNYAAVITSSWGGGDFGPACDSSFLQMAAQGQSYLNATGDDGAFNGFTYLPPSSDPYITQVGGTDLTTNTSTQAWVSETGWADAGGGFFDPNITIPSYQQTSGVITASNGGSTTLRNSPDFAAEANFDNTQVSEGSFLGEYGGTSYATPRMAGYIALANQQSVINGTGRLGFLNPKIYQLGLGSQATYFHDITSGKNTAASYYNGVKAAFNAVAGYDLVTGWGSPNGPALLNALIGPNFAITASSNLLTITRGSSGVINIPITPINNYSGSPALTMSALPAGVTAIFSGSGSTTQVQFSTTSAVALGTTNVTITAAAGAFTHSVTIAVSVQKRASGDFSLSASSVSSAVASSAVSTVTIAAQSGFDSPVSLTLGTLPTGVTAQFGNPSPTTSTNLQFIASTSAAPGSYTVVVTGTSPTGVVHSTTLTLTITAPASVLQDGGFESSTNPWVFTSTTAGAGYLCTETCGFYQHGGSYFAYINGFGAVDTDTLSQTFSIPVVNTATLNFWLLIATAETSTTAKNDTLTVTVTPTGGTATTLVTLSNLNKGGYTLYSYDLSAFRGQTVKLTFTGVENSTKATAFLIDDVSVIVQ